MVLNLEEESVGVAILGDDTKVKDQRPLSIPCMAMVLMTCCGMFISIPRRLNEHSVKNCLKPNCQRKNENSMRVSWLLV